MDAKRIDFVIYNGAKTQAISGKIMQGMHTTKSTFQKISNIIVQIINNIIHSYKELSLIFVLCALVRKKEKRSYIPSRWASNPTAHSRPKASPKNTKIDTDQ